MSRYHRNIFAYFRGSFQPEHDREKQLEDNTTKALINTLEHSHKCVSTAFLEWLHVSNVGPCRYVQQKSSIGDEFARQKAQRVLLAIVGSEHVANTEICDTLPAEYIGTSRPDAWVYGDSFAVLIESKVGSSLLTTNQMACHWDRLRPTEIKVITWADVHRFFRNLSSQIKDATSQWLVGQFTDYLEWTGMTDFSGFREEMFEFFVASERDADTQRWVRSAIEGLGERVLNGKKGLRHLDPWYASTCVGNLPWDASHFWVAFGPEKTFRNAAHLTISLYEDRLDVFVNIELLPAIKKLRQKIAKKQFREAMARLPAPFTVRIEERKSTSRPRIFDYFHVADIESGTSSGEMHSLKNKKSPAFDYIESMMQNIEYPYLSIRRSLSRQQVLELSEPNCEDLVNEVLSILYGFHPFVHFVNN